MQRCQAVEVSFLATLLPVFVASPGDLALEREVVVEGINAWNRDHSVGERVAFVPVAWEWAVAAQGEGGQAQINTQQVRSADVVIAMFKSRLGRPTEDFASGTDEEIAIGIEQGAHVSVLVCRKPEQPGVYAGEEYARLEQYLEGLRGTGLTQDFRDDDQLRKHVDRILWRVARTFSPQLERHVNSARPIASGIVDWRLSHWNGDTYELLNTGTSTAFDVQLVGHPTLIGPNIVDGGPDIEPGGQLMFMAARSLQTESAALEVSWLNRAGDTDRETRNRQLPARLPRR